MKFASENIETVLTIAFNLIEYDFCSSDFNRYDVGGKDGMNDRIKRFLKIYNLERIDITICIILVIIGGILRVIGYNWDGGHMIFQPDESNMVWPAIYFVDNKKLFDIFRYPAQFFSKMQGIVLWQYVRITQAKLEWYMVDAYLICRIFTAIVGTFTIVNIFLIGNYLHKHLGTISCMIFTFSPVMIMMSKQVTGDVTTLFLSSLVMLFATRYTERQRIKYLIAMSFFAASATMEKWHGGAAGVFIGVLVLLYSTSVRDFAKRGIIALFTYVVSIVIIAPNIVFNIKNATDNFLHTAVWEDAPNPGYMNNFVSYVKDAFIGLGYVYIFMTVAGIIFIIASMDKKYTVLLLGVVKALMMSAMNRTMVRWGLELYFSQIIVVAFAFCYLWEKRNKYFNLLAMISIGIEVMEAIFATVLTNTVANSYEQDVRFLQEQFCYENGIGKDETISGLYTAFLPGGIRSDIEGASSGNLDNIFVIRDGEIYRTQDFNYYVWSSETDDSEYLKKLEDKDLCIWQEKVEYSDVFGIPYYNAGKRETITKNDILLCIDYLKAIKDVMNGAVIGAYDIKIYDISRIPSMKNN